ncbi:MAG: DUF5050 domain-containing protein [Acidobacteriia bacterium]|nr:DUF5050 domain-containing protein [Terriglobia bacterium]
MRKVLFFSVLLIFVGIALVNCGDNGTSVPKQFAFIRAAAGSSLSSVSAQERHFQMEHSLRTPRMHQGVGLKHWTNDLSAGDDSVVLMNTDGTGELVIAPQMGWFEAVQESADTMKGVGTAQDSNGNYQVIFVDLADKKNPVATEITTDAEYHWSPQLSWDGTKVVFVKTANEMGGQAVIMPTSGSHTETVISTPFWVSYPSFTPNGKIVFEEETNDTINIMNQDGTGNTRLTNADHAYFDECPSVSPDGKTIVFSRYPTQGTYAEDIWTVNIDGTNPKQLTTDGMSWDPMFVKDKIVFVSWRDNASGNEVYSMNLDGTNQKRLTNNNVNEYFDDW